jgi:hypothetical protein
MNKAEPATEKLVDSGVSQQRRMLVRASAAVVPAIMTLRSGAAAAATSLTCMDKLATEEPQLQSLQPDQWVRIPGKQVLHANKVYYCVADNSVAGWECFDQTGVPAPSLNPIIRKIDDGDSTDTNLLAYVDFSNNQYTYYPKATSAPAGFAQATGSCMTSVDPNFNNIFG